MTTDLSPKVWTKAIPPARDRLQSRVLVWIMVPLLCYLSLLSLRYIFFDLGSRAYAIRYLLEAIPAILFLTLLVWRLKAATPMAAACGGLICFMVTVFSTGTTKESSIFHSELAPLILLFVLTFEGTQLGRKRKAFAGLAESRRGRNAAQVVANLGMAAFSGSLFAWTIVSDWGRIGSGCCSEEAGRHYMGLFFLPTLAALTEATADTVSSEIGQAFGGRPFLITTLRRVPPGTDGAISLSGTLAGIAAAAIVAITGAPAMGMSRGECIVAFVAGICGFFFDSLLGATLERRGYLGNDLVNFTSTAFAAGVSILAIRYGQDYLMR
jgi:uncharacterized protein (TIGR00297 family)